MTAANRCGTRHRAHRCLGSVERRPAGASRHTTGLNRVQSSCRDSLSLCYGRQIGKSTGWPTFRSRSTFRWRVVTVRDRGGSGCPSICSINNCSIKNSAIPGEERSGDGISSNEDSGDDKERTAATSFPGPTVQQPHGSPPSSPGLARASQFQRQTRSDPKSDTESPPSSARRINSRGNPGTRIWRAEVEVRRS